MREYKEAGSIMESLEKIEAVREQVREGQQLLIGRGGLKRREK